MPNQTTVTLVNGVPTAPSGTVSTIDALMADGGQATLGAKADAKSTATDTTAVSGISIWKQISSSIQALTAAFGAAWTRGAGAADANTQRVTVDSGQLGTLGQSTKAGSVPVAPASDWVYNTGKYVAVAASQTTAVIQASAGAAGDYLDHVVVIPATTAPGVVTIFDNATSLIAYPGGGTTALLTLTPFTIYVGAISSSGAWKITTGANVSVLAVGRFS